MVVCILRLIDQFARVASDILISYLIAQLWSEGLYLDNHVVHQASSCSLKTVTQSTRK